MTDSGRLLPGGFQEGFGEEAAVQIGRDLPKATEGECDHRAGLGSPIKVGTPHCSLCPGCKPKLEVGAVVTAAVRTGMCAGDIRQEPVSMATTTNRA
jgi:hypothetical protein